MAFQLPSITALGATINNPYIRIDRCWGNKQGISYVVRSYFSRAAYEANSENHINETTVSMPYPPSSVTFHYPDDCYSHAMAQPQYAGATAILEVGQTAAAPSATI